jgi:hypothetical protein
VKEEVRAIIPLTLLTLIAFGTAFAVWQLSPSVHEAILMPAKGFAVTERYLPAMPSDGDMLALTLPGVYTICQWGSLEPQLRIISFATDLIFIIPIFRAIMKIRKKA